MPDTLFDILGAHESALVAKIAKLRAELGPLETDLEITRRAKLMAGPTKQMPSSKRTTDELVLDEPRHPSPDVGRMTMKQLVMKALTETFPDGAASGALLNTFHRWGRTDIVRESLSPQLSRLKADNKMITLDGKLWKAVQGNEIEPPTDNPRAAQSSRITSPVCPSTPNPQ